MSPDAVTLKPPQVHGLICGGAGRPAWTFGHSQGFLKNCSPRFFAILHDFGYSRGFQKNCSPLACRRLGTDAIFVKTDPNLAGNQGEQLNENSRLCPILAGCLRIHGIRNSIFLSCAQMPGIHGELFRKICSCAQMSSQRDLHASAKSGACRTSAGFFLSLSATAPFLVYNCGSG